MTLWKRIREYKMKRLQDYLILISIKSRLSGIYTEKFITKLFRGLLGLVNYEKLKKPSFPQKCFYSKACRKKKPKCVNVVSITPFKKITEFMAPWSGFQALGRNQNANIMKKYYKIFYRIFFLYSHINLEKKIDA